MDLSFISNIVSNTEQVGFLATLKDRFDYWNAHNKINQFYNNLPHDSSKDFATEPFQNGFVVVTKDSVCYDDLSTGECHRLEKIWNNLDHDNFVKLSTSPNVRTETVSEHRTVFINGTNWMYTKYSSPNGEYGTSIMINTEDPVETSKLFVDQGAELIKAVKEIGAGKAPTLMLSSANWWKDSNGWFWSNLQDWSSTLDVEKTTGLLYLKMTLDVTASANKITKEQATEVLNYAKLKWV